MSVVFCDMSYLYISLGAIAGAISRYQIDLWAKPMTIVNFKWSTLFINVSGSFLIGVLANVLPADQNLRLLLMVGFCGAFTTFSTYSLEIVVMLQSGRIAAALGYLAASAVLAPLACYLGYAISSK
jgi:fluoride exporter